MRPSGSDTKKGLKDHTRLETQLMKMWLDKYPSLLRVPIETDHTVSVFLGAHPLQWLVSEQRSVLEKSRRKGEDISREDAFTAVEQKLKDIMARRHLARIIQAGQAHTLGANPGFPRWMESLEWTNWAVKNLEYRDEQRLLTQRLWNSPVTLSDQWAPILRMIKLRALEMDDAGRMEPIKASELGGIEEETVVAFLELYPQYIHCFEESLTLRLAGEDLAESTEEYRTQVVTLLKQLNTGKIGTAQFKAAMDMLGLAYKAESKKQELEHLEALVPALERVTLRDPFDEGFTSTGTVTGAAENLKLLFSDLNQNH